jgi:hypothetical protein
MNEILKGFFYWFCVGGMLLTFVAFILWGATRDNGIRYVMPNDVVCKFSELTGNNYGKATHEFRSCSDGRRYINPEYYSVIKIVVKNE